MSEVLFLAAPFITYAVYRSFNAQVFRIAAQHTELIYGATNTAILLTSSLTMTVALRAATARLRQLAVTCLLLTALLGIAFVTVKGLEYHSDLEYSLFPGPHFPLSLPQTQLSWDDVLSDDRYPRRPSDCRHSRRHQAYLHSAPAHLADAASRSISPGLAAPAPRSA